jgi:hypothetical protein
VDQYLHDLPPQSFSITFQNADGCMTFAGLPLPWLLTLTEATVLLYEHAWKLLPV